MKRYIQYKLGMKHFGNILLKSKLKSPLCMETFETPYRSVVVKEKREE